jgi:hypothetical protein
MLAHLFVRHALCDKVPLREPGYGCAHLYASIGLHVCATVLLAASVWVGLAARYHSRCSMSLETRLSVIGLSVPHMAPFAYLPSDAPSSVAAFFP